MKKQNPISKLLSSLVGEKKELNKYSAVVKQIEAFDEAMQKLTDEELRAKTFEFRAKIGDISEQKALEKKLLELLPEAFAVVREASWRVLGLKHYPVQLVGGMVQNEGRIAEMRTGEGKTLVATLSAYLNALPKNHQVHVVTVNDYLARRDGSEMGRLYNFLGLTLGVIQNQASFYFELGAQSDEISDKKRELGQVDSLEDGEMEARTVLDVENLVSCERSRAYHDGENHVDIVYGVNSEFGFDYLRDNMVDIPAKISQKAGHQTAIIDEVDSILIDEARTPLIISSQDEDSSSRYKVFANLMNRLNSDFDYVVDEKRKQVSLTELGVEKMEKALNLEHLYSEKTDISIIHHLDQALKAHSLFKIEKDYVVKDGEIIIVDEFTGRMMFGRRYNQGLHQAIEAKEGVKVQAESRTSASVTFQNYFRMYKKLAGMTGTANTESEELFKIYKLVVVTIPTNKPTVRDDKTDKIFKTELGKFQALTRDIAEIHSTGQPILVGTTSIDKNLMLAQMLKDAGIAHQVLNAKNHEQEARIISEAGKLGAVTIATNIAGRGVDIKLGGNVPEEDDKKADWKIAHNKVKELGGLFVIGTERHESRRVDNQLRGRSGRQGDEGVSQFYISLEDYIIRAFGGDQIGYYKNILPFADDEAIISSQISWLIEQAQKKIEGQNFDARKNVTDYDDVINRQRQVIYSRRNAVLKNDKFDYLVEIQKTIYAEVQRIVAPLSNKSNAKATEILENVVKAINELVKDEMLSSVDLTLAFKDAKYNHKKLSQNLTDQIFARLTEKLATQTPEVQSAMVRFVYLRAFDILWTEHLITIEHLQDSVRFRSIAQKEPLTEFKEDGMKMFKGLLEEIDSEVAKTIFKMEADFVPTGMLESMAN